MGLVKTRRLAVMQTVIASRPGINRKGILEQVGVAPRSLDRLIAAMIESGKIKRLGGKKAGGYY